MSGQRYTKVSSLLLTFCLVITSVSPVRAQFGTGRDVLGPTRILQGDNDPPGRQDNRPVDRRQVAQDDIQNSARQLDETLVSVLEMVNRGERLTPEQIQRCKAVQDAAKKYAPRFDDGLQCEVFMLQAWMEYFQNDLEKAFFSARQAYRTDRANQDANATQAAMSIVMDRAPEKIEPRRERPMPGGGGQDSYVRTQSTRAAQIGVRASTGNILNLDVDAIDLSLLGKPVGPMKLTCLNGTTLDYDPTRTLCVLFWQLGVQENQRSGEPNIPGQQPLGRSTPSNAFSSPRMDDRRGGTDSRRGGAYDDYSQPGGRRVDTYDESGRRDPSYDAYRASAPVGEYGYGVSARPGGTADPLGRASAAYSQLFGLYVTNPQVTFLGVNTDALLSAPAAVEKVLANPWPWAHVMAAIPHCGAGQFGDIKPARPTMAIVSGGKIKYAGPADGFLAPMVLEHAAGAPVPLSAVAAAVSGAPPSGPTLNMLANLAGAGASSRVVPPAVAPSGPPPVAGKGDEEEELTPENLMAEKKLGAARDLFIPAGRKTFLTSKRGVDLCREIIRDYPNTRYAQEARLLLRQVPENERKRYNVTDEEMGL